MYHPRPSLLVGVLDTIDVETTIVAAVTRYLLLQARFSVEGLKHFMCGLIEFPVADAIRQTGRPAPLRGVHIATRCR